MMPIKRIITLTADSDKLVFDNEQQLAAFEKALGRMIFYGMTRASENSVVNGGIQIGKECTDLEICLTYKKADNSEERGFTMSAIARENGKEYTFHS